jgi:putative pyruvate formate lyase activating enzyme
VDARGALRHYYAVLEGRRDPLYLRGKKIPVAVELDAPEEDLRREHSRLVSRPSPRGGGARGPSLLDLKIELTRRLLNPCRLCERRCKVDRTKRAGFCRVKDTRVASRFVHWGEEPELVPSYTVFFSGCTFACVFCQNWDISQRETGVRMPPEEMARDLGSREGRVANVNWVGGEPTFNLPYILDVLHASEARLPQVWNSNMYMSWEVMEVLDGMVDLYLADFKYGPGKCSRRLSRVANYWDVVTRNHRIANSQTDMVLRHLVMPNHLECCTQPVLGWIAENLDNSRVRVNVMDQYRPEYRALDHEDIARRLRRSEFIDAWRFAEDLGLNLV